MGEVNFDRGRFMLGDCFDHFASIPDGSVDMVLCDLPYGTTRNAWDSILPLDLLWQEYWRMCKPSAAVVLTAQTPFDKILGVSALSALRYEWIWEKPNPTGHLNSKRMPLKTHENILVFYRSLPTYVPQKTAGHIRRVSSGPNSSSNWGNVAAQKPPYDSTERFPRSVQVFANRKHGVVHPTEKPVALFEYLIKTYTNPGETVLDNTAGSGTTAVAAENTDRRWICIEKEPSYFWAAIERVAACAA